VIRVFPRRIHTEMFPFSQSSRSRIVVPLQLETKNRPHGLDRFACMLIADPGINLRA